MKKIKNEDLLFYRKETNNNQLSQLCFSIFITNFFRVNFIVNFISKLSYRIRTINNIEIIKQNKDKKEIKMSLFTFIKKSLLISFFLYLTLIIINHFIIPKNTWKHHSMEYKNYPVLVAHRGGRGIYPENTLEAFRISHYRYHADLLESDIQMTKDHKFVLLHNLDLKHTTNMSGLVKDYTLSELKKADAAYYFTEDGKTFPLRGKGIHLTTLEEFLDEFYQKDVRMSIELKDNRTESAIELINVLEKYPNINKQVCIDCSNHPVQKFFRNKVGTFYCTENDEAEGILAGFFGKIGLGRLYYHFFPNEVEYFFAPYYSFTGFDFLTDKFYVTLQDDLDIPCMYFTINTEMEIARAVALGAKGVLTDRPDIAYKVFVALGLREDNANITKETEHYHVNVKRDAWEFSTPLMRTVEKLGGMLPNSAFTFIFICIPITILLFIWNVICWIVSFVKLIIKCLCCCCCCKRKNKKDDKKKKD